MNNYKKWIVLGGVIALIIAIPIIWLTVFYTNVVETVAVMHEPIGRQVSEKRVEEVVFKELDPFSVLLLGVDERESDVGRSDTIVVITVNPTEQSTKIVSIPRDTYTELIGRSTKDKINHAYAFGGTEMAVASIEKLLDIPIDYVATINMEGFESIVDAVGGISVTNDFDFQVGDIDFPKGEIQLDGQSALTYVQMRYDDPRGDFGRQDRQKQIIEGILRKGASLTGLMNYKSIFNALGHNVRTNLTFDEMSDIQKNYRSALDKVEQLHFQNGDGHMIDGIWYYLMDDVERQGVIDTLKAHLEM
ncbi:LCP family protein [Sporosarcina sp. YIM B06819]|uniref:LCP family glycopolymer transferase n=1 Tax=Sporosarcina sp. YIM B06819 TaxID=3081769 RepID=UPI00298CB3B6|nr:LCP family protein [Sporosarcina sp. YIM B06819]